MPKIKAPSALNELCSPQWDPHTMRDSSEWLNFMAEVLVKEGEEALRSGQIGRVRESFFLKRTEIISHKYIHI
jgi:hypothetical protein